MTKYTTADVVRSAVIETESLEAALLSVTTHAEVKSESLCKSEVHRSAVYVSADTSKADGTDRVHAAISLKYAQHLNRDCRTLSLLLG